MSNPPPSRMRLIDGRPVAERFTEPAAEMAALLNASAEMEALNRVAEEFEANRRAPNTKRSYESHWRQFLAWCQRHHRTPLPASPETVRLYITDLAIQVKATGSGATPRYKVSSIRAHLSAIARAQFEAGFGSGITRSPEVSGLLEGIARTRQEKPSRRKPLLRDDVATLIDSMDHSTWPAGVSAARDTFAILFGFATALRRENQAALLHRDVVLAPPDGLHVFLGVTKTDQTGDGAVLAVPFGTAKTIDEASGRSTPDARTCPLCAYARWVRLCHAWDTRGRAAAMRLVLETPPPSQWTRHVCRGDIPSLPDESPLFRRIAKSGALAGPDEPALSGAALYEMLNRRLELAGYDPTSYGWHSLRAGMVTQARRNGATTREVRKQTLHGTDAMVDLYDRDGAPLRDNAVTNLGL